MKTKSILMILMAVCFIGNLSAKSVKLRSNNPFFTSIVTSDEIQYNNSVQINISQFIIKDLTDPFDLVQIDLQVSDAIKLNENGDPNEISINLHSKMEDYYFIELFDNNGTLLYELETKANNIDKLLDFSKFDKGNYKLCISNINDEISIKYNIEKLK